MYLVSNKANNLIFNFKRLSFVQTDFIKITKLLSKNKYLFELRAQALEMNDFFFFKFQVWESEIESHYNTVTNKVSVARYISCSYSTFSIFTYNRAEFTFSILRLLGRTNSSPINRHGELRFLLEVIFWRFFTVH